MKQLSPLEAGAARAALSRLLDQSRWFDITAFDALCKVVGVSCDGTTRNALHLLHCVHWRDMDRATREEATRAIVSTFGADLDAMAVALKIVKDEPEPAKPAPSLWKRLRGAA